MNNHEIACMMADFTGDDCACNFNDIDEWLPLYCDFKDTCCPEPVGVACWEQYLKYLDKKPKEPRVLTMPDLKPCPFCSGKAVMRKIINSGEYVCSCELCNATPAPWGQNSEEEAANIWNTREK